MSDAYAGAPFVPPNQDAPNPRPGIYPTIQIPDDFDPKNAATYFLAQYRAFADFIAYMQKTAKWRPPFAASAVTAGFSSVATGTNNTGTGVVTVTSLGSKSGSLYFPVIKIILGGARGVATFQWSNDSGASYGATQTTAATYTDATSGVTVAFSNDTYVANDTYSFWPSHSPLATFLGEDGSARSIVDHMGFPGGRLGRFTCGWDVAVTVAAGQSRAQLAGDARWNRETSANAGIAREAPAAGFLANAVLKLTPGTANTNFCQIDSEHLFSGAATGLAARMEFDVALSAIGANLVDWTFGLSDQADDVPALRFYKDSTDTNWGSQYVDNAVGTSASDSGIAPVANAFNRFRIEWYAPGTTSGKLALFFIDDKLVGAYQPAADLGNLCIKFRGDCIGAATSFARVGPVDVTWARFLDVNPL